MEGEGVSASLIDSVDVSAEEIARRAFADLEMKINDETDEAVADEAAASDAAWKMAEIALGDKPPTEEELLSEMSAMLFSPSGTERQMTERLMESGKKKLQEQLGPIALDECEAKGVVSDWARATKHTLTAAAHKALTEAIVTNSEIELDNLEYILLGWNLRGDHNVTEVKNVMNAHQELLNDVMASQREFKASSKGLLTGFSNAITKMANHVDKMMSTKTLIPQAIPPSIQSPQSSASKTSTIPSIRGGVRIAARDPAEKSVQAFLKIIGRTERDFEKYFRGRSVVDTLEPFIKMIDDQTWNNLHAGKGKENITEKLIKYASGVLKSSVKGKEKA